MYILWYQSIPKISDMPIRVKIQIALRKHILIYAALPSLLIFLANFDIFLIRWVSAKNTQGR